MSDAARPPGAGAERSEDLVRLDDAVVMRLLPERDPRAHKGTRGTLIVVAGSLDHLGAALLATLAATRAGAGLVCLAVPASLQPLVAGRVMEAVTLGLPERSGGLDADASAELILGRAHDALVVGPGLAPDAATSDLVRRLLAARRVIGGADDGTLLPPAAVDAQALNVLAASDGWSGTVGRACVLTPHPGEFRRLDGLPVADDDDERLARAATAARRWGHVVVLKGARTVIVDAMGAVAQAPFENPALATAGTGDVLTGTIGALLAQGLPPFDAARLGVYLHGVAAERLADRLGTAGLVASDLPVEIATARRRLEDLRDRSRRRLGFGRREPEAP